jgi:hypothetical protein
MTAYELGKSLSNTTAETLDAQQNHATALVFWQARKHDVTIVSLSRLLSECLGHHVVRRASTGVAEFIVLLTLRRIRRPVR